MSSKKQSFQNNKEVYKKQIVGLRKLLDDNQYIKGLSTGYHGFLSEMHRKLVSDNKISPKMLKAINDGIKSHTLSLDPEFKNQRDDMMLKIDSLRNLLLLCRYEKGYEYEKLDFVDSLTKRIARKGSLTAKQAKYANNLYKQFKKRIDKMQKK